MQYKVILLLDMFIIQSDGEVFLSVDGNFGLCRKAAAGASVRDPLHGDTFFMKQADVDGFVRNYQASKISQQKV